MLEMHVESESKASELVTLIHHQLNKKNADRILLNFDQQIDDAKKKDILCDIKNHFDLFVLIKAYCPTIESLQKIYGMGVHGVCFEAGMDLEQAASGKYKRSIYNDEAYKIMDEAVSWFRPGLVLAEVATEKSLIEELLIHGVLPKFKEEEESVKGWLMGEKAYKEIVAKEIIPSQAMYQDLGKDSLSERVKKKMILEALNFRQKLRVRQVEESFHSSGL